jgi:hypothetical protein
VAVGVDIGGGTPRGLAGAGIELTVKLPPPLR